MSSVALIGYARAMAHAVNPQHSCLLHLHTFCGHREDAVCQQLEHVLQALAVRLVAALGQVLLQNEALDRLAAGSKDCTAEEILLWLYTGAPDILQSPCK